MGFSSAGFLAASLKYSLIGVATAALFFPLTAPAGSALTNPGGEYVPCGLASASFILIPWPGSA